MRIFTSGDRTDARTRAEVITAAYRYFVSLAQPSFVRIIDTPKEKVTPDRPFIVCHIG